MENEMIINEEVIETAAEEIAEVNPKKGLIVAGVALVFIGGVIVYNKIIKPAFAKRKAKKEVEASEDEFDESEEIYSEEN